MQISTVSSIENNGEPIVMRKLANAPRHYALNLLVSTSRMSPHRRRGCVQEQLLLPAMKQVRHQPDLPQSFEIRTSSIWVHPPHIVHTRPVRSCIEKFL